MNRYLFKVPERQLPERGRVSAEGRGIAAEFFWALFSALPKPRGLATFYSKQNRLNQLGQEPITSSADA